MGAGLMMRSFVALCVVMIASTSADCSIGSPNLCGCSQLIEKHIIKSMDDCTQEAAIAACKAGTCVDTVEPLVISANSAMNVTTINMYGKSLMLRSVNAASGK